MDVPTGIRFYTDHHSWLCFRCAVRLAMANRFNIVRTELGAFEDGHYMGPTTCQRCNEWDEDFYDTR